jgi:hypothetical protein
MAHYNAAMPVQENSQDHMDFLLSKIRVRYDEIAAEQQRLAVRAVFVVVCGVLGLQDAVVRPYTSHIFSCFCSQRLRQFEGLSLRAIFTSTRSV